MEELEQLISLYREEGDARTTAIERFASHIGVTRQGVLKWLKAGRIPENAVWRLQVKTAGRFNAEKYLSSLDDDRAA